VLVDSRQKVLKSFEVSNRKIGLFRCHNSSDADVDVLLFKAAWTRSCNPFVS
jgi:hypothetical protein